MHDKYELELWGGVSVPIPAWVAETDPLSFIMGIAAGLVIGLAAFVIGTWLAHG